jgi:hypothetical protein
MKKGEWYTCSHCEEEFRVLSDSLSPVIFCPFCGEDDFDDEDSEEFDDSRDYDYED